jgi:hypothetical protein
VIPPEREIREIPPEPVVVTIVCQGRRVVEADRHFARVVTRRGRRNPAESGMWRTLWPDVPNGTWDFPCLCGAKIHTVDLDRVRDLVRDARRIGVSPTIDVRDMS